LLHRFATIATALFTGRLTAFIALVHLLAAGIQ